MKFNPDTFRKIILAVEGTNSWVNSVPELSKEEFNYHAKHLIDNEFAEGKYAPVGMSQIPGFANIKNLTLKGHELVSAIEDASLWDKAKDIVIKPAASWTVGILFEYLQTAIRQRIGL